MLYIYNKKWKIAYALIFAFFFYVYSKIPIVQDSWAYVGDYISFNNFWEYLLTRKFIYMHVNGRIINSVFSGYFERNKLILNISNSLIFTSIIYSINKLINKEKNIFFILASLTGFLLVSNGIRTEVYFYATTIYIMPVLLLLLFLINFKNYLNIGYFKDKRKLMIFCLLSIFNSMWVENSSAAFICMYFCIILYRFIIQKIFDKKLILIGLVSTFCFIIMMASPGLRENRQFTANIGISAILYNNLYSTIKCLLFEQKALNLLLLVTVLLLVITNNKISHYTKVKKLFSVFYCFMIFVVAYNLLVGSAFYEAILFSNNTNKVIFILGIIYFLSLLILITFLDFNIIPLLIYIIGFLSIIPVSITPNWSYRVCFFLNAMLIILWIIILGQVDFHNKIIKNIIGGVGGFISFVAIDSYFTFSDNISIIQQEREQIIHSVVLEQEMGNWDYNKIAILPKYSINQLMYEASPNRTIDPIHYQAFLKYYKLNSNTLIAFQNTRDELRCKISDEHAELKIIPEVNNKDYLYTFYMIKDGEVIKNTSQNNNDKVVFEIPPESGIYTFGCTLVDKSDNQETIVYSIESKKID